MKFRSKFEEKFNKLSGGKLGYEQDKFKYIVPASTHTYTPDFKIPGTNIYIETKGLWSAQDRKKHLLVKAQNPDIRIIIVFYRQNCPISKGSKTTYEDWATKNCIEYMTIQEAIELIKRMQKSG